MERSSGGEVATSERASEIEEFVAKEGQDSTWEKAKEGQRLF
jgi:hypothetical protein